MTSLQRRLPGVRVEVPAPALREALPRMDIALFVGFTAAGPVDLPVAVESLREFEAVFGGEILLARDPETGDRVRGLLHPCVRGFFSDGGRRCWVVRVAASPRTTVFPLANLLLARRAGRGAVWRFEPALIAARSPGSWADGLGVATRLHLQSVQVRPAGGYDDSVLTVDVLGPSALEMRSGDVLRFRVEGERQVHARVAETDAPTGERDGRLRRRVHLRGLCALQAQVAPSTFAAVSHVGYFEPAVHGATQVERRVPAQSEWTEGRFSLRCRLPAGRVPGIGAVLRVRFARYGRLAWFTVAESVVTQSASADGRVGVQVWGRLWNASGGGWRNHLDEWIGDGHERPVDWLRLDLHVGEGNEPAITLENIAMADRLEVDGGDRRAAPGAPTPGLSIHTLPDDQRVFGAEGEHAEGSRVAQAFELTRRDSFGRLTRRFPLASVRAPGDLMLIPLGAEQEFGPGLRAAGIDRSRLERDGLDDFSWRLFAEPLLADSASDTLADQAEALRLLDPRQRTLRGMHAGFGSTNTAVADEPTLLAIPDAVHPGWRPAANAQPAWTELPPSAPDDVPDRDGDFIDCAMTPLPAPVFVRGADPDADGNFLLQWTQPEPGVRYELQEASDAGFAAATLLFSGSAQRFAVLGKKPGSQCYRVRARFGSRLSAWSPAVDVHIGLSDYEARGWRPDDLLAIHRLMLRTAAGRGDMLAVLGLPRHYRFRDAVAHASALRDPGAVAGGPAAPRPIGYDEVRALSHGALYHPWLLTRRVDNVVASPPDGAACGQLAAKALERGAWTAVANQPLRDVVALSAAASREDMQHLLDAQVNLVRSSPHGFVLATADTLTPEADWRPINVRRLMTLLRRLALQRGATYVFEPNGPTLRRTVERSFESVMDELFRRGAFAGANARAAYRVEVGDEINTPQRNDLGQFWVELKVAPALPLTFLTVRLARSGERLVARETR